MMEEKKIYARAPEGCCDYLTAGYLYPAEDQGDGRFYYRNPRTDDVKEEEFPNYASWEYCHHLNGGNWTRLELTESEAEAINANLRDPLDSHPDSEPDADQYTAGADTMTEHDMVNAPSLAERAAQVCEDRGLNPHDAASFLHSAMVHMEDRASTYDADGGERSMGKTVAAFNAVTGHSLTEEQGWLFMVLLKAVRTQQGGFRSDNYEDGAAYFGLQGEAAARDRGTCND